MGGLLVSITKTHWKFKPMLSWKGSSRSDWLNVLSNQTLYIYFGVCHFQTFALQMIYKVLW